MKLTTHHLRTGAALLLAGILLAGCDQSSSDAKHIKVGVINGAEQDVAEVAKKVAKEKYGLDVQLVGFSGSLLPNDATNHGELDANVFQHRPFLEQDNQAHGYKLVAVGNTFVFPMAGYSKKIKTVAQIKEGATVAIPNDPTNLGRALLLLQKEKLITLKEGKGLLPTALDITDNPRHLQIMELEGAQLPRVLDDPKVDVAIISTTYIQQTGLSPVHDSVFIEDKNSPYVNILVAREDNKNAENVKEFLQSYQSSEVAKAAETIFNGSHFNRARDAGWHITVHAGEAAGPESIWQAIRELGAERIGHGVKAIEDRALMDFLAEQQIGIESCLTSNIQTSTVAELAAHPLKTFLEHGIRASINTDDPGVQGVDIIHEYTVAAPAAGLSREQIRQAQINGLEMAFLSAEEKRALREKVAAK